MYAHVNGVKLFFDIEGGGFRPAGHEMSRKPVLFLLHGGPGADHTAFRPFLHPLADDFQLVFIDHRGNGRSDRADVSTYTIEQMADDVEALREYLGLDEIMLLGHSFGGKVAQAYALRHRSALKKLVLSNTTPGRQFNADAQEMAQRMATPEQLAVIPALFEGRIRSQADFDAWFETCLPLYFRNPDPRVLEEIEARMIGAYEVANHMMAHETPKFDVRGDLPTLRTETLVIVGRHDWITPVSSSEEIHGLLPNSQLVVMENSGHMGFVEEPELYMKHLREFLHS